MSPPKTAHDVCGSVTSVLVLVWRRRIAPNWWDVAGLRRMLSMADRACPLRVMVAHVHRGGEDKVPRIAQQRSARSSKYLRRDGRGSSREMEHMMTRNRRRKAEIHAHQAATGTAYLVARRQIIAFAEVMQQHPQLNSFGIGVFDAHRKTAEERQTDLAAGREELAGGVAMVMETAAWLRENITPIKTPTASSYSVKHVMEQATGSYVTNGEFIAAALLAGYTFKYAQPNVLFGMSDRDLKRMN
ncbi:hypothetical protein [Streptomyces griseorubiginosus]|uniref:hypothetical protein n=1 Tax=Streptomyces griseorubiginosus TaxID=67304 RepID=UPI0033270400